MPDKIDIENSLRDSALEGDIMHILEWGTKYLGMVENILYDEESTPTKVPMKNIESLVFFHRFDQKFCRDPRNTTKSITLYNVGRDVLKNAKEKGLINELNLKDFISDLGDEVLIQPWLEKYEDEKEFKIGRDNYFEYYPSLPVHVFIQEEGHKIGCGTLEYYTQSLISYIVEHDLPQDRYDSKPSFETFIALQDILHNNIQKINDLGGEDTFNEGHMDMVTFYLGLYSYIKRYSITEKESIAVKNIWLTFLTIYSLLNSSSENPMEDFDTNSLEG